MVTTGCFVGDRLGGDVSTLGAADGISVGNNDGDGVSADGALVGDPGMIGESDGLKVGDLVGLFVGDTVGSGV